MIEIPTLFLSVPSRPPSDNPRLDRLTRIIAASWRKRITEPSMGRAGVLVCTCGAQAVTGGTCLIGKKTAQIRVDAFCVHRLAFHRDEMTQSELDLVAKLGPDEVLPAQQELRDPPTVRRRDATQPTEGP